MNTLIKDGGPAFPVPDSHHANGQVQYGANGMTLRDYFAVLADTPWNAVLDTMGTKYPDRAGKFTLDEVFKYRAEMAYRAADAMLAAREKGQP